MDLLIGFAIGKFANSAAVATDDGTSGADGRTESIGESDTGADAGADDAGADDAGTDATADEGTGATDGATADFVECDVPQPATNTAARAVTAVPTAMRAFIVGDVDGERAPTRSRWHPQPQVLVWRCL